MVSGMLMQMILRWAFHILNIDINAKPTLYDLIKKDVKMLQQ